MLKLLLLCLLASLAVAVEYEPGGHLVPTEELGGEALEAMAPGEVECPSESVIVHRYDKVLTN